MKATYEDHPEVLEEIANQAVSMKEFDLYQIQEKILEKYGLSPNLVATTGTENKNTEELANTSEDYQISSPSI